MISGHIINDVYYKLLFGRFVIWSHIKITEVPAVSLCLCVSVCVCVCVSVCVCMCMFLLSRDVNFASNLYN